MTDTPAAVTDNPATPAPETPATPAVAPTLATPPATPAAGDPPATPAPDWRSLMAGEDKDALTRLGRFADPSQVWKSYRALEQRISSGDLKRALPENASPEEAAQWRKENGLPENEQGYVGAIKLPDGLVIGDADKPLVEDFAKHALAKNWTPAQYNDALAFYYNNLDKQKAAQEAADAEFMRASEDVLRNDWQGNDYRRNTTAVQNLLSTLPGGLGARLATARDGEGKLLGNDPAFLKAMAQIAFDLNPTASLLPAGTSDPIKGVDGRMAEIEAMMKAPRGSEMSNKYWRDEAVQKEYRDLINAKEKIKSRAA